MGSEWFDKMQEIFHRARPLEGADRAAYLDQSCGDDGRMRDELESLLQIASERTSDFMEKPALGDQFRLASPVPPAESHDATMPETVGPYRLRRRLGAGGMGVVYEAEQKNTGSIVALKVIRPGAASTDVRRRFDHEAQVLGRLRHAGIARVYEAGFHDVGHQSAPFIAMELIAGPSLLDYVREKALEVPAILKLFVMICDAVQHAHQKGVIHRDLKPGNILIDCTDHSVQPKILDFGIARITDADTQIATLQTQAGQLIGTVKYMSPEQAAGDPADIDTRSDVYALGVILYELLARRMPYEIDRKLLHEAVRVIREDEPKPLSSVSRLFKGDLTTILGKALDKDKTRRYQTASELASDIRRFLRSEPIAAHPHSAIYQLRKFARRHRGMVAATTLVFLLLVSGIITTSWQAAAASRARDEANAARLAERAQRERAERRLSEVRSLARTLIFELDGKIMWLPGSTPARELLVNTALKYLASVAEDIDPSDEKLQAELGTAYFKLGSVQGDLRTPSLGDAEGALQSYKTGLRFIKNLAETYPDNTGHQIAWGKAENTVGEHLQGMGRSAQAAPHYDRALQIYEDLHRLMPENAAVLRELGQCYSIQASAHRAAGRPQEAADAGERALQSIRASLERDGDEAITQHALASAHSLHANTLEMLDDQEGALHHRRRCYEILEALVARHSHNAVFRNDLCLAAEGVGNCLLQQGKPEEALDFCRRAVEVGEALLATDHNNREFQHSLLVAWIRTGECQLALGRLDDADGAFRKHFEMCQLFAAGRETDVQARRILGVAYYKLAEAAVARARSSSLPAASRTGHWQEAIAQLKECHAIFADLKARDLLPAEDAAVPDELIAEIAMYETELASLGRHD